MNLGQPDEGYTDEEVLYPQPELATGQSMNMDLLLGTGSVQECEGKCKI